MQLPRRWRTRLRRLGAPVLPRPGRLFTGGLMGVALAMLVIHFLNSQLRPVMAELAAAQIQNAMTLVIDEVVAREVSQGHVAYDDIIRLETDGNGAVTALKSDMAQVNLLRSDILSALVDEVDEKKVLDMGIPLGNLTGIDLLSGRGPEVPVKVLTTGSADAVYENAFTDAGINQTRHQVMLYVTVPVRILLPGYTTQTSVSAQVCVAETVIVGQVPETYLQFGAYPQLIKDNTPDNAKNGRWRRSRPWRASARLRSAALPAPISDAVRSYEVFRGQAVLLAR